LFGEPSRDKLAASTSEMSKDIFAHFASHFR